MIEIVTLFKILKPDVSITSIYPLSLSDTFKMMLSIIHEKQKTFVHQHSFSAVASGYMKSTREI